MIEQASINANELIELRTNAKVTVTAATNFSLSWQVDTSQHSTVKFMGYEQAFKTSDATGLKRMYYDRSKPFTKNVKYFNVFASSNLIKKPTAYIIPQGWYAVIDLLKLNGVKMHAFNNDTILKVEVYHIDDYKSAVRPYEKHHKNNSVKVSVEKKQLKFLKGDFFIPMNQTANRYIIEMLEPTGDDSFFAWNFFDAILQQKEGYSDYRWEDVAAAVLKDNPGLQKSLKDKKEADPKFASNASAQLDFIYKNSPYYEPAHLRYPVFRFIQ